MQFPSLTTSVSPTGGSTTLSGAQVDLFLEQMRQQTSQSNEAKRREKRELAEQVQRNLEKRKNELQHTRLQMIADSRQTQDRRARLDAIDDRRALRRAELDRKERNAKFDLRLDQQHRDSQERLEPPQIQAEDASFGIIEPSNMLGIARQAAVDSKHFTPTDATEAKTVVLPTDQKPQESQESQEDATVNEFFVQNRGEYRLKGEEQTNSGEKEVKTGKVAEAAKTDSVETGKQMQMLAAFSDVSGRLAATLKQPIPGNSGVKRDSAWLKEKGEYSEKGMKLDSIPLEQKPSKLSPEFLADLDAALGSRGRKKEPAENGKDDLQAQLQQAESQHRPATKNTHEDRPMLDQMERIRLVQRVANACLYAANRGGTIRIRLHPESLGSVFVKIRTKNKAMEIELETETESAKSVLLENVDDLKQQLQTYGMSVEAFFVQVRASI